MDGEGEKERCAIFCIKSCWWQPPESTPRQAPCEDLGVKAGFQARFVRVCGDGWGFLVGWVGWCQMGAGGRTVSQLSLEGGMDRQMYMCVCGVVQGVHVACV